ncbi:restriction endonuclease subunit S [Rhodococcus sp. IEGM 1408]|uniref:restriction endonuclease subunit S n=1 Tax=Rhodococcus sp. IEGM 1408 TaxID=3082220 RepID=UPI0029556756|nr:restriction endonuclease subunit S [Rhodococcus sp. IEGM 1408]MDV8002879.1 restriction endonuclease subunit S [Rhodococcus sp. IEGM 1408]
MRDGWIRKPLGEIFEPSGERVGTSRDDTDVLTVTKYDGVVLASQYFDKRVASKSIEKYKLLNAGDWAYSTIHIDEGSIARNNTGVHGAVSPMYTTMRMKDQSVLPRIMEHVLRSPVMLNTYHRNQQGSINRRRSLPWKVFAALSVTLPPLHEQERIVDLMDSIDAAISAAQAEVNAAVELRSDLFDGLLQQFVDELEVRTLGELGEFIRGRRFTKSDYVEDGLGCIHYGQVHTHFGLTANQPVTFIPIEMKGRLRFATTGDVVIAATSEDIDALGKATVWLGAEDVAVHDDCQIFRHDLDPLFATHLIASHGFHRQKVQYAAGTKVTRISGPNLAKITVQVPQRSRQEEIGRTMASLDALAEKAQSALDRLRNLRSSMLSALLSGEHEIPETYDQFLDLSEVVQAG